MASLSRESAQRIREKCMKYHSVIPGVACANCNSGQQEHVRFPICSGCRMVTYCDTECQTEHWPTHGPICKIRQKANVEKTAPADASSASVPRPSTECEETCLDKHTREYFRRSETMQCCHLECDNDVLPPYQLEMCIIPCQLGQMPHMTPHPILFCYLQKGGRKEQSVGLKRRFFFWRDQTKKIKACLKTLDNDGRD